MAFIFVMVGSTTLAVAFLAFAWTMQRRRSAKGEATTGADDAVVGTFSVG